MMEKEKLKAFLEGIYYVYARRELVYPDPLYYLYNYDNVRDMEIVGLIASSLAYGRVAQIMKSVDSVLSLLGSSPREFLLKARDFDIVPSSFKHRFTTSDDMNNLLQNISFVLKEYDNLEIFLGECIKKAGSLLSGLDEFSSVLSRGKKACTFPLLTQPKAGSPCKRLFLCLRWLSRSDPVDPGGWSIIHPAELIVPLDTHMNHISNLLHLSDSHANSLNNALSISRAFSEINPLDPVKYDFCLTRFGIRSFGYDYFTTKN